MLRNPSLLRRRADRGLTLVELLITAVIIGVIAGIAVPIYLNQKESSGRSALIADLNGAVKYVTSGAVDTEILDGPIPAALPGVGTFSSKYGMRITMWDQDTDKFCIAAQDQTGQKMWWASGTGLSDTKPDNCPDPGPYGS